MEAAEDQLANFESIHRMKKVFADNDLDQDGVITVSELRVLAERLGADNFDESRLESVLEHVKFIAGRRSGSSSVPEGALQEGIPFDLFADLLYSSEAESDTNEELLESVRWLRAFFMDCSHARILAEAVEVSFSEINEHNHWVTDRTMSILDLLMGLVIFSNAVVIGISLDHEEWCCFEPVEIGFVVVYVLELCFKLWYFGVVEFFVGPDWHWHIFDACLVIIGLVDILVMLSSRMTLNLSALMYIRMLRLTRLARLVRLLQAFKDLSIMVTGLIAGMRTMMWVMVLLIVCIYTMAIILTSTVGRDENAKLQNRELLFGTVMRSMFTMFVCLTDGCTNLDGTPISLFLFQQYGALFFVAYTCAIVIVTFGLFNLIMAIFVENTLESAKTKDNLKSKARHAENLRVARKLKRVISQFTLAEETISTKEKQRVNKVLQQEEEEMLESKGLRPYLRLFKRRSKLLRSDSSRTELNPDAKLTRGQFHKILGTSLVQRLLDELEIDPSDRGGLFDLLDSDGSQTLTVEELVSGLMAIRGQPKKSDPVAALLAVKSMQKSLRTTTVLLLQNQHDMLGKLEALECRQEMLTSSTDLARNTQNAALERVTKLEERYQDDIRSLHLKLDQLKQSIDAMSRTSAPSAANRLCYEASVQQVQPAIGFPVFAKTGI